MIQVKYSDYIKTIWGEEERKDNKTDDPIEIIISSLIHQYIDEVRSNNNKDRLTALSCLLSAQKLLDNSKNKGKEK
ncbi:MAG: hypothetical protein OXF77_00955 [Thaumarchaeota archaeon]|nr:hypothetical protein [Nitrososphaerota archaeon]